MTVIPVSDDPFDENRNLGIDHKKVFIPFGTDEITVYFDSRVPTQHDIKGCTKIVMTNDMDWDPQ